MRWAWAFRLLFRNVTVFTLCNSAARPLCNAYSTEGDFTGRLESPRLAPADSDLWFSSTTGFSATVRSIRAITLGRWPRVSRHGAPRADSSGARRLITARVSGLRDS